MEEVSKNKNCTDKDQIQKYVKGNRKASSTLHSKQCSGLQTSLKSSMDIWPKINYGMYGK